MLDRRNFARAIADKDSFAVTLLSAATAALGEELFEWDPATIQLEIRDELGIEMPRPCVNRLNAAITLSTSNFFYQRLPDFIDICNTLWDGRINTGVYDPADTSEIAWGITEALLIWPPDKDDDRPFSDEILGYIGHTLAEEGIHRPPDVLRLGTMPPDQNWGKVAMTFSDDPEMFAAVDQVQAAKVDDIDQTIRERMTAVVGQLEALRIPDLEDAAAGLARLLRNMA